jgi:hypothetical protein
MERLDTGERLLSGSARFVRKYQPPYAEAISNHLKSKAPDIQQLVYVGDAHKNDGTAIRNLQKLGWRVSGFICEPELGLKRLWFNDVLYTDHWTDLVSFEAKIRSVVGADTLALFAIDQTLWAPKGIHHTPLTHSRTRAMARLIDEYAAASGGDVAMRAKERIELIYDELSNVKYLPLTLDNEDFKAVICVSLALNLIFDQPRLESSDREAGAAFFEELGRLEARQFCDVVRDAYLRSYLHPGTGEANITRFIMDTLSTAQTHQYSLYGETNGILVGRLVEHLRDVFRETVGMAPIQYAPFRAKELEEALIRVGGVGDLGEQLVLNKPAWDFAIWLRAKGCMLMALSDRPDESTVSASGESLLDAPMTIYGTDISTYLH